MRKNRFLDIICVFLILLIVGIVGTVFYVIFTSEDEPGDVYAEVKSIEVKFDLNGANYIDKKMISCDLYEECEVTLPVATRKDGVVLGYDIDPVSTEPEYQMGETIKVNENMTLYVISYIEREVRIDKNNVDYLESDIVTCKAFNKEQTCLVTLPRFNKIGYENRGYSSSVNSIVGFAFPNERYKVSKNATLYPIYGTNNHLVTLKIDKVLTYHDTTIEIESGCGEDVYNDYLKYIEEINSNASFLLLGNKISFVSDDSFDSIWGDQYVGMNFGPYNARSLDVRCSYRVYNDYYGTMVHEMSHSWDFFYGTRMDGNLSSQSDIINLYNKYSAKANRPFRDYSFSNIYEFLADAVKYYYFKYLSPKTGYKELVYPEDIRTSIEKYICIANNNYKDEGC